MLLSWYPFTQFLAEAKTDEGTGQSKMSYKCVDESANWEAWWAQVHLKFSNLTGPLASHMFEIMNFRDIGHLEVPVTAYAGAPASHPRDIVCRVRQRMPLI